MNSATQVITQNMDELIAGMSVQQKSISEVSEVLVELSNNIQDANNKA